MRRRTSYGDLKKTVGSPMLLRSPPAYRHAYQGGINSATKSLAIEYAKAGIRLNALARGILFGFLGTIESFEVNFRFALSRIETWPCSSASLATA